jgi:hypothetical protein
LIVGNMLATVSYDYLEQLYSRLQVNDINEVELLRRAAGDDAKTGDVDEVKSPVSPGDDNKVDRKDATSPTDEKGEGKEVKTDDEDENGAANGEPTVRGHQGYDALRADQKDGAVTGFNLARVAHVGRLRSMYSLLFIHPHWPHITLLIFMI